MQKQQSLLLLLLLLQNKTKINKQNKKDESHNPEQKSDKILLRKDHNLKFVVVQTLEEKMQEKDEALENYTMKFNRRATERFLVKSKIIQLIKNFEMKMFHRFTTLEDFTDKRLQSMESLSETVNRNFFVIRSELEEAGEMLEYRKRGHAKQEARIIELNSSILELKKKLQEQYITYHKNKSNLNEIITDNQREIGELRQALQAAREESIQKQKILKELEDTISKLKASTTDSINPLQNKSPKKLRKHQTIESKIKLINISMEHPKEVCNKQNIYKRILIPKIKGRIEEFIKQTLTKMSEAAKKLEDKIQIISQKQSEFAIKKFKSLLYSKTNNSTHSQHKSKINIENPPSDTTTSPLEKVDISTIFNPKEIHMDSGLVVSKQKEILKSQNEFIPGVEIEQEEFTEFSRRHPPGKALFNTLSFSQFNDKILELNESIVKVLNFNYSKLESFHYAILKLKKYYDNKLSNFQLLLMKQKNVLMKNKIEWEKKFQIATKQIKELKEENILIKKGENNNLVEYSKIKEEILKFFDSKIIHHLNQVDESMNTKLLGKMQGLKLAFEKINNTVTSKSASINKEKYFQEKTEISSNEKTQTSFRSIDPSINKPKTLTMQERSEAISLIPKSHENYFHKILNTFSRYLNVSTLSQSLDNKMSNIHSQFNGRINKQIEKLATLFILLSKLPLSKRLLFHTQISQLFSQSQTIKALLGEFNKKIIQKWDIPKDIPSFSLLPSPKNLVHHLRLRLIKSQLDVSAFKTYVINALNSFSQEMKSLLLQNVKASPLLTKNNLLKNRINSLEKVVQEKEEQILKQSDEKQQHNVMIQKLKEQNRVLGLKLKLINERTTDYFELRSQQKKEYKKLLIINNSLNLSILKPLNFAKIFIHPIFRYKSYLEQQELTIQKLISEKMPQIKNKITVLKSREYLQNSRNSELEQKRQNIQIVSELVLNRIQNFQELMSKKCENIEIIIKF